MDVIPTDGRLVRGSHGLPAASPDDSPVFISTRQDLLSEPVIAPTAVRRLLLEHPSSPKRLSAFAPRKHVLSRSERRHCR